MTFNKLRQFAKECMRVFKITRKPTKEELKTTVMVSGLGILLIGAIGFLIFFIKVKVFS
jgi:protein transport protein SEC61 subunit gamma-like protein